MNKVHKLVPTAFGDRRYVLFDGDEALGRVEFERMLTTRARATTKGEEWSFERVGVLNPGLIVRRADGSEVLAVNMTLGGAVDVTLGEHTWRWKSMRGLHGEHAWIRDDDHVVIRYQPKLKDFNIELHIEIIPDHFSAETERLLLFLGAYLAVQTYTDTAVVTAAVMAATIVT